MTSRKQRDEMILKNRNSILYVLRIAGYPLKYTEIVDAITDSGMLRGYDINDMINALLEMKCVVVFNDNNGIEKYAITRGGKNVCDEMLVGELSNAEKRKLLECTLKIISFKRKGGCIEYSVDSPEDLNEKSVFRCRIFDGAEDVLKLELAVDSDFYAQLAARNFSENPELIYREIITLLTKEPL